MWFLFQSTIIFAVMASNIHWHWTPNGYLAGLIGAREAESRSGKGEEAGGNGKHVPATGETGGEAGREIRVRAEAGDNPTDNPRRTQQVIQMVIGPS
jgi:hypothetical protein